MTRAWPSARRRGLRPGLWSSLVVGILGGGCVVAPPSTSLPLHRPPAHWPGPCSTLRVDDDGTRHRTEMTYDGDRLVAEVERVEPPTGTPSTISRRFVHDPAGRRTRVDQFEDGRRQSTWMSYDDRGRWVATEVDATGRHDVVSRTERGYDAEGRAAWLRTFAAGGEDPVEVHAFDYDDAGRLVEERVFRRRGEPSEERIEFRHDARGRVRERIHHRLPDDTLLQRDVYAYDPGGRLSSLIRHGAIRQTQRYSHDASGNLLRVDYWDEEGEPIAATVYDYACWVSR